MTYTYHGTRCRVVEAHMDSIFATVEFEDKARLLVRWEELEEIPAGDAGAEGGVQ